MSRYLAFDLGAERGRAVVGHLDGDRPLLGVAAESGGRSVPVVATAEHDTAAAAAVPSSGHDHLFIGSVTRSLMGIEATEPIATEQGLGHNTSNEGGVNGTVRFPENFMGLQLAQEYRREWQGGVSRIRTPVSQSSLTKHLPWCR